MRTNKKEIERGGLRIYIEVSSNDFTYLHAFRLDEPRYNGTYHDHLLICFGEVCNSNYHQKNNGRFKLTPPKDGDLIEQAIQHLIEVYDPFAIALELVNKTIEENVKSMKYKLHLRIAEFRGFLFENRPTSLRCERCHKPAQEVYECECCGDLISSCCQAPYNQHSQIDYNCCVDCK